MTTLEATTRVPLYEQVRERLRAQCLENPDGMLPSLRQLSQDLEVNHLTISRALRDLEAEGLVEVIPRKGVFVNPVQPPRYKVELITFFSEMQQLSDIAASMMQGMNELNGDVSVHGRSITIPPIPPTKVLLEQLHAQEASAAIFLGAGYLSYPESFEEARLIHEIAAQMPVVITGCPVESLHLDCVYGDPRPQLQEYLLQAHERGLRRYAYLGSHIARIHFQERVVAFREFLLDHGIAWDRGYFPQTSDATAAVQQLFSLDLLPEVIIAANLHYAFAAVMEAQRRDLRPGEDIHVLCFASIEADARPILPYATVILLDEVAMGRQALELAHERLLEKNQAASKPRICRLPAHFLNRLI